MSKRRADSITQVLLNNTVLNDWFQPMQNAFEKVRFSDRIFQALPMVSFALFGGLRQLKGLTTLREQVQALFHSNPVAEQAPVARSTWSDAMASPRRCWVLHQAVGNLVECAQTTLADKYAGVEGIGQRSIIAIDATYQKESSHYRRVLPTEGGSDNQKGHMLLTYYDLRRGIPLHVKTTTASLGEMRVLKEDDREAEKKYSRVRRAIYVVDRAFVDGAFWDKRKKSFQATMITRMKSTLSYQLGKSRDVAPSPCNENVLSDHTVVLNCSTLPWRLIKWCSPEGITYEYLTNDFSLAPGVVAFLYYRRWDEEKYFDNFKNDLANARAWGASPVAIEQQALLGIMTYILTMLFLQRRYQELELTSGDQTQARKHRQKVEEYLKWHNDDGSCQQPSDDEHEERLPPKKYDAYRAFYSQLSKITLQVWRFLKECCRYKHSQQLYQRQLKPLLMRYL